MDSASQLSAFEKIRSQLLTNSRVSALFMGNPKHAFKDTGYFYEERHFLHFHPLPDELQADLRVFAGSREELLKDPHVHPHTTAVANETGWLLYDVQQDSDVEPFLTVIKEMLEAAEKREPAEFRQMQP